MKSRLLALLIAMSLMLTGCQELRGIFQCSKSHTDADDNGKCDVCASSVTVEIDIYAINDLHGKMFDTSVQPGSDELTTLLKSAKLVNENSIFISSGDMWQGSFESNLTRGLMVTDWMNELGFSAMTLGNHEFDWGTDYIESNAEAANFPILAINLYENASGERPEWCESSVLIKLSGVKVGIIGAIGDVESSISSDKIEDVGFSVGTDLTNLVKAESDKLRAEGADIVVYSLHDGATSNSSGTISVNKLKDYYDPILSSGFVDIVFEGHTHRSYVLTDALDVYHIQGGGDNDGISYAQICINTVTGTNIVEEAEVISSEDYSSYASSSLIDELAEKYSDEIAPGYRTLGKNSRYRSSTVLEDTVAELYLKRALEVWGDEYDIFLGGGYLKTRTPYNLYAGDIKYSDLVMLFPFENEIVLCEIRGDKLKSRFLSDLKDYHTALSDYGEKNQNKVSPGSTYYVVVDSYTAQYEKNGLTVIKTLGADIYARDLLAEHIASGGFK